ncbi:MAG TPA: tRNA (adenosine(37)-N6)-threonylcarbamoyltransferase complex transferase subunit TsaD [Burkholderiales bacterium]|jgi:N6-L-threonylcarbamoyladenine synthase|nr:tRNA (adenosine(37)-N6)-threonylcarbamoyltransferase complex transferase subunit TsaD [Burkholderiales bacterium]HSA70243.1 tRNA (adenosine(37)-N6)-threonylcarbamoyltransferase complex transferase subunit TsaD [Burkholderiales bacterium]
MLILGIETSCDDTGVALYDSAAHKVVAHAVHTQASMHEVYGGVVPELASRDHIRRLVPLTRKVLGGKTIDGIGYTEGPGLAGALLVGASFAHGLAVSLGVPAVGVHHLEGHLLSPLLSARRPEFPFLALLVSGGHTQLMRVDGVGRYELLGDTQDDAAGEAFDKTAQLLGLGYPGGPALSKLAESGTPERYRLPRPMIGAGLDFSFSGLKTAVLTLVKNERPEPADVARAFVDAIVEVLVVKCARAVESTGLTQLVVAGGVGANAQLRSALDAEAARGGFDVFYPEPELCTDNGAMIALAAAYRLRNATGSHAFNVKPRWDLQS